jgi:hypothetical protein
MEIPAETRPPAGSASAPRAPELATTALVRGPQRWEALHLDREPATSSFSQPITGLTPATTYYYCALATNSMGMALGAVQTFITPSAPTAFTAAANSLTNTSANLNGSGNPNRASATGWFRYSTTNPGTCDDKFGSRAPLSSGTYLGSDIYDQPFSQSISGLSPATTYYYCAIVASTEGTAFGAMMSFTTHDADRHHQRRQQRCIDECDAQAEPESRTERAPPAGSVTAPPIREPATTASAREPRAATEPTSVPVAPASTSRSPSAACCRARPTTTARLSATAMALGLARLCRLPRLRWHRR